MVNIAIQSLRNGPKVSSLSTSVLIGTCESAGRSIDGALTLVEETLRKFRDPLAGLSEAVVDITLIGMNASLKASRATINRIFERRDRFHKAIIRSPPDCGNVINPLVVDGQLQGGIAHGIGNALLEWMRYDENAQGFENWQIWSQRKMLTKCSVMRLRSNLEQEQS